MTKHLEAGDPAPDFDLPTDAPGERRWLRSRASRFAVFYPKDDTSGCTSEAKAFTEATDAFAKPARR